MTAPKPDDTTDPATLGRLAGSVGALTQQVADIRRRLQTVTRRLDQADIDQLAARLADLDTRFGQFADTINDALDAVAPKGPPAPRWDNLDPDTYAAQLEALRTWVDKILIPVYVAGGGYTLAECWAEHPQAPLGARHHRRGLAPRLPPPPPRPGPGPGLARPVAARRHAPPRRRHPPVRHPAPAGRPPDVLGET